MQETETKDVEQIEAIEKASKESLSLYDKARALIVKDQESYDLATDIYKAALEVERLVDQAHDPVVSHWHNLHKNAVAAKKADKDKATEAKKLAKSKAAAWQDEQERLRLEEERRLQEEAQRQAEEEARKERERLEAERRRLIEEEEKERIRLAEMAEQNGASKEEVDKILDRPLAEPDPIPESIPVAPIVMPTVAPTFQKAAGFTVRYNYSANIVNFSELVRAAVANDYFMQYLQPNEQAINAQARNSKEAFRLPGCVLSKKRV